MLNQALSRDIQKSLKNFNGAATSAFNVLLLYGVLPYIFVLNWRFPSYRLFIVYPVIIFIIFIHIIAYFIPFMLLQTVWCHGIIFIYSNRFYIDMTVPISCILSINLLLIFEMSGLNGILFLKVSFLFLLLATLVLVTIILSLTTIFASL